jgi:hypothetical protein
VAGGNFPFRLEQPQQRKGCLSIALLTLTVLYTLAGVNFLIVALGLIPAESMPQNLTQSYAQVISATMFTCALGAFGMWRWRRWGVVVYSIVVVTMLGVDVWLRQPYFFAPAHVTIWIVILAMIWNKWEYME